MNMQNIHTRGLTSLFTLFGFLIMSITGLVLYVVPEGRVAYWITWTMLGLSKTDWGNIHILSSILFIVAGAFHIYFNWRPLINYFKKKTKAGINLKRELVLSSVLSVWIVIGSIWPHPPLSYLLDFNEWLKKTWVVEDDYEPPFGHAELMSLNTFTQKMDIDLDKALAEFRKNGIIIENIRETLENIGKANNISPMNLYLLIKKFEPAPDPQKQNSYTPESIEVEFMGTGFGNKTIGSICDRLGLDTTIALNRLEAVGLSANINEIIKSVAERYDTEAIEVMKVMLLEDYSPKPDKN